MLHIFRFVVLGWFCCLSWAAWAQNTAGYGDWQLHLPATRPLGIADTGDGLYVTTETSLFYLDKKLGTTRLLSRRDGLNDVKVAALAYDSVGRQTILAYGSGNLDMIQKNGAIRSIPDVVRKNIQGNKVIYQVITSGTAAYVATSFGLLNIDLEKLEVRDTYSSIGVGGQNVEVFSTAVWRDTLYAATTDGLLRGSLQANLLDYRNWVLEPNPARAQFRWLAVQNGYVYAAADNSNLFRLSGVGTQRQWRALTSTYSGQWRRLQASTAGLLALTDESGLLRLDAATGILTVLVPAVTAGRALDVARQSDGSYFLASRENGLIRVSPDAGQPAERFVPNEPATISAFNILADAHTNTVDVFSGGFSDRYVQQGLRAGFYEYQNGQWTNFTSQTFPAVADYPNLLDLSRGTRTPDGTLYIASYGNGLLEWQGAGKFRQFTQGTPGSPLLSALPNAPDYTRITDVAADSEGEVWVVNRHSRANVSGLFIFNPGSNAWETVSYFPNSNNLDRIVLDENKVAWVSESRKDGSGLWAVDRTGSSTRHFTTDNGLPSNELNDLVKDRRGFIWVATGKGVASFDDPGQVFDASSNLGFQAPLVRRGEGTGFPALWTEPVRCAAVDGGNRKWFGTDNGLWLFSEDVNEALLHFTTANSPLPSNRIVDLAVNDKTGEVFVATDAGLVSYRGRPPLRKARPIVPGHFLTQYGPALVARWASMDSPTTRR